jgi:hypothetical protein
MESSAKKPPASATVMNDDQTSVSSLSYDQELNKVRKRLSKLTVNGASTNSLLQSLVESEGD